MKFDHKELRDFFSFGPQAGKGGSQSSDPKVRESSLQGKGLKVKLRASHAGMVNLNFAMYSPKGMRDSVHTWVWPQRKPVQVHHDDSADPIGRVISARFVSYDRGSFETEDSGVIASFLDEATKKSELVEAANMLEESGVLQDEKWRGVGELELEAIITDSEAIQKILDGRYQGVSISQRPVEAFCSICGQDWIKDGMCSHHRGEIDEESKKRMFIIVGLTKYSEVSYINHPADEDASTTESTIIQDSVSRKDLELFDNQIQVPVSFELVDMITLQNLETSTPEQSDSAPLVSQPTDSVSEPEPTLDPIPEVGSDKEDNEASLEETVSEAMRVLFEESEDFNEAQAEIINEAMEQLVEESDAALSPKERKALPSSVFCGPGRSFPVPNCSHFSAALRLLGRYKGPGDKSKILSCINSKGKSLNCSLPKEKNSDSKTSTPCLDSFSDLELVNLHSQIEKALFLKGLKARRECPECIQKDERIIQFEAGVEKNKEVEGTLRLMRNEWHQVIAEHVASESAHQDTLSEFEKILRSAVETYLLLTDKNSTPDEISTKVEESTFQNLMEQFSLIDVSEVIKFARSGITQNPTEEVTISDATPEEINPTKVTSQEEQDLAKILVSMRKRSGIEFAQRYLDGLVLRGRISNDFTLDKAQELMLGSK